MFEAIDYQTIMNSRGVVFPIMATEYALFTALRAVLQDNTVDFKENIPVEIINVNRTIDLVMSPKASEIYDGLNWQRADLLFSWINVTNDVRYGIKFGAFSDKANIANTFDIVGTYEEEFTNLNFKYVSIIKRKSGIPFYATAFNPAKQIFNYFPPQDYYYDLSYRAVVHS